MPTNRRSPRTASARSNRQNAINNGYRTNNSNWVYNTSQSVVKTLKRMIDDNDLATIRTILSNITSQDMRDRIPVTQYRSYNRLQRVLSSLGYPGQTNNTSIQLHIFHYAVLSGKTSVVRAFLNKKPSLMNVKSSGPNSFELTTLQLALLAYKIRPSTRLVTYLLQKGASTKESLHLAVNLGLQHNMLGLLIRHGANKNERDERNKATPLFYARDLQTVRLLITSENIDMKDKYGWTAIMAYAGGCYAGELNMNFPFNNHIIREFLARNASVRHTGSNRDNRTVETRITLLHIISASYLNNPTSFATEDAYKDICEIYRRKGISMNKRTSLGNTPIMYALSSVVASRHGQRPNTNIGRILVRTQQIARVLRKLIGIGGANISLKNNAGKDAYDIARTLQGARELQPILRPAYRNTNTLNNTIHNLRIPNNLNFTDPILMNNVSLNNAYILTTDLHKKRNNSTQQNIQEVKTVYNKSSLNGIVQSGRSLVSPMTRKPFSRNNIVKLVHVTPRAELNRYKAARNQGTSNVVNLTTSRNNGNRSR